MAFPPVRELSLRRLLDDPDPVIQVALMRQFSENRGDAFDFLERLSDDIDDPLASNAHFYLKQLFYTDASFAFLYWMHHQYIDLLEAAAVIEHLLRPEITEERIWLTIATFAERVRELAPVPAIAREKILIINRILFHEWGFRPESDKVLIPRFSLLYSAIQQRRGLSFTLAVLYKIIAEHIGLDLDFILFPSNHVFLQFVHSDSEPIYIDPAESGAFHTLDELNILLSAYPCQASSYNFRPLSHIEILKQWCQRLVHQCSSSKGFQQYVVSFEKLVQILTQEN